MMEEYFNKKQEKSIFKNKNIFSVSHIPETIKYRDKQIMTLVDNVRSIDYNTTPSNMVLQGKFATGKTITIKSFFKEAEKQYDNLICLYLNCQLYDTENKILIEIYNKLLGRDINGGLSSTKLVKAIIHELGDKYLIVCLDEFQNIQSKKDLNNILYTLSRSHEYSNNSKITTYLITTYDTSWQLFIDDHVYTVFLPHTLDFPQYTKNEIHDILQSRVDAGFYPEVVSQNELMRIVDSTYIRGDLRYGICRLRELGELKEHATDL